MRGISRLIVVIVLAVMAGAACQVNPSPVLPDPIVVDPEPTPEPQPDPDPEPTTTCDAYASPTGDDGAAGTAAAPVFSPRVLASRLAPGQTGCFTSGTYVFTGGCRGCIATSGQPGSPITLTRAPGADVRLTGLWEVTGATHDVVIRDLVLDGTGLTGPNLFVIAGDRVELRHNDITNQGGICVFAGTWNAYSQTENGNRADDIVIAGNEIHDCGQSEALWHDDAGTSGWHGVYLSYVDGATVVDNVIRDNRWRGMQTWPYAKNVVVANNVFDGNGSNLNIGSVLQEGYPWKSSNVVVRDNLITNATFFRPDKNDAQIHGNFPNDGVDYGNRVTGNCIWQADGGANFSGYGFVQSGNTFADPGYADTARNDFEPAAGGACPGKGPRVDAGPSATAEPQPAPEPVAPTNWEGRTCTIWGTEGDDVLTGTSGADVICGLGGDDTILAGGGDDLIDGGAGTDLLSYEAHGLGVVVNLSNQDVYEPNGSMYARLAGIESATGGAADDVLVGSSAANRLDGDAGNDALYGYAGDDLLIGGDGVDSCRGGDGSNTLIGCES